MTDRLEPPLRPPRPMSTGQSGGGKTIRGGMAFNPGSQSLNNGVSTSG